MSIDIKLVQTAKDKKTLPLKLILGADFLYGSYDEGWRLRTGLKDEDSLVCYMPMQLARGITVTWNEEETDVIGIRALTPTATVELRALYEMIYRICTYWECDLFVDDQITDIEDFFENYEAIVDFNQQTLKTMAKSVMSGENSELTLFAVKWPLVMGKNEAEAFIVEPSYFSKWMHDKQKIDAHHANPAFYRTENGVIGRYAISEGTRHILPISPYVPYGFDDPETGELIQCEDFGIIFFDLDKMENIGELDYKVFVSKIRQKYSSKIRRYDGNHLIVEKMTFEELKNLLDE